MGNNNFERGLSNSHEERVLATPEIVDRVLVKMEEPGAYGPGHTVEWVKGIRAAIPEGANLIEIGMVSRRGE